MSTGMESGGILQIEELLHTVVWKFQQAMNIPVDMY